MSVCAVLSPAAAASVLPFLRDQVTVQSRLARMSPELREAFLMGLSELEDASQFYFQARGVPRSVKVEDAVCEYVSTAVAGAMLGVTERQVRNKIEADLLRARRPEGARAWQVERQSVLDLMASSNR